MDIMAIDTQEKQPKNKQTNKWWKLTVEIRQQRKMWLAFQLSWKPSHRWPNQIPIVNIVLEYLDNILWIDPVSFPFYKSNTAFHRTDVGSVENYWQNKKWMKINKNALWTWHPNRAGWWQYRHYFVYSIKIIGFRNINEENVRKSNE